MPTPEQLKNCRIEVLDMTSERIKRMQSISDKLAVILQEESESPLEAFAILEAGMESLRKTYGIVSAHGLSKKDIETDGIPRTNISGREV